MIGYVFYKKSIADWQSVLILTVIDFRGLFIIQRILSIVKNIERTPKISTTKGWQKSIATVEIKLPDASILKDWSTKYYEAEISSDLCKKKDLSTTKIALLSNRVIIHLSLSMKLISL